jgi:hypothetical protein
MIGRVPYTLMAAHPARGLLNSLRLEPMGIAREGGPQKRSGTGGDGANDQKMTTAADGPCQAI